MAADDEVFGEALERPAAEREAWLDRRCGDDTAQRARVARLLSCHERAGAVLVRPVAVRGGEREPGARIGPYTLGEKLGEGGCGVVYRAERTAPPRQTVALKTIRHGLDTAEVVVRFEAEWQALARMDHPNIARVFEAGATAADGPYFAMELVPGVALTRFCDERRLGTAARLELFLGVCGAVEHAHARGVVHRDLKPSNILVASGPDGQPVPKVIDFGIAKATEGRLTDRALLTPVDMLLGTPAYMSPEQAQPGGNAIDGRSDIYSLGVLLYELLAGRPPFDPQTLQRMAMDEARRVIRELDPPPPSRRLRTLAEGERETVARQRRTAVRRLDGALRGELDWIVMHALRKERGERYASVGELAADVRRYLRHEPIAARPRSWRYVVRKWVRRRLGV